jgi:hypothetical protein
MGKNNSQLQSDVAKQPTMGRSGRKEDGPGPSSESGGRWLGLGT